jgi:histidyl-tRNA synthetase
VSRPRPLSGFPEWLPAEQIVAQTLTDRLRRTFELHGFAAVQTRAVEPVPVLLGKGETDKEIYLLRRLQGDAEPGDPPVGEDGRLGLHFDLTVPLARYVLENAGRLSFPFRRYQIQQVWRGERPQEGRYREFTQADIDVVGDGTLSFHHEVEVALVAAEALASLPIPAIVMRVNNRKVAEGFYLGLGLDDVAGVLRVVDKLDKVGPDVVAAELAVTVGATSTQARQCLQFAGVRSEAGRDPADLVAAVTALGVQHPRLDEGLAELVRVLHAAEEHVPGVLVADLSVARGLDYYTGTVYETHLVGLESLGSICSGGRYDELARDGERVFPGVGISVGVTRLVGGLLNRGLVRAARATPTCVLVAVPAEEQRVGCERLAAALRRRGIPTEVSPTAAKYGKQIRHADRRGIPYVWFPGTGPSPGEAGHEVKDIRSGDQHAADPDTWMPPAEDRAVAVQAVDQHEKE